jgi:2-C-methyl-D-erythritol 2,4-cyclodiphosphate synthase
VGFGFDSHEFGTTGTLRLGGVRFSNTPALRGHSDGDALIHAVIDSLLGAAGLGDIGEMFSDRSSKWKGADSRKLLAKAMASVRNRKLDVVHIDTVVLADEPRLAPHKKKMQRELARALGVSASRVNLKAKTQEGLRWFAVAGIAAWAVATLAPGRNNGA